PVVVVDVEATDDRLARPHQLDTAGLPQRVVPLPVVAGHLAAVEHAPDAPAADAELAVVVRPHVEEHVTPSGSVEADAVRPLDRHAFEPAPCTTGADGALLGVVGRHAEREPHEAEPAGRG